MPTTVAFGVRFAVAAASHGTAVMKVTIMVMAAMKIEVMVMVMVMVVMVKVVDIDKAEKASFVQGVPIGGTTVIFSARRIGHHVLLITGIHRCVVRRCGTAAQQRGCKHPCQRGQNLVLHGKTSSNVAERLR
ncbi:hypothetical protein M0D69_38730 [Caballeronia sp. SEWSISQ10-4 2]|uniref:hypothetical protein n=1 Tax=Caballeronia sp. SEWSISQ10-4 2 TaxID=2937438 RepID=UPI002656B445|nr:hypothetical protein [Caballeronia sp. SEWSISQ10-4 2]MDN7183851.1 hypothetical protein [Caballeronia sp. SEWSISQ10-4 2]